MYYSSEPQHYQQERVNLSDKLTKLNHQPPANIMSGEQKPLTRSMSRRFYRFESLAEVLAEVLGRQQSDPNLWVFEVAWEVANKGKWQTDLSSNNSSNRPLLLLLCDLYALLLFI